MCVTDVRVFVLVYCDCWHKFNEILKSSFTTLDFNHNMNNFSPHSPFIAFKEAEILSLTSLNTESVESEH